MALVHDRTVVRRGAFGEFAVHWALLVAVTAVALTIATGAAFARHHHSQPGCSSFCRNAGGFGSGPGDPPPRMSLLSKKARLDGSVVPLTLSCLTREPCNGALILTAANGGPRTPPTAQPGELGRVDLSVPGRAEWIVDVTLSPLGREYVQAHGHLKAFVVADYKKLSDVYSDLDLFDLTILS